MSKLWQKGGASLHSLIERFEVGDDLVFDNALIEADVYGSLAHAEMLTRIGVLTEPELGQLREGLSRILSLHAAGEFAMTSEDEDVHTKIENFLVSEYGEVGKKVHTARSRNDQVLLDLRLYAKEKLLELDLALLECAEAFARFASDHEFVPMPGYTHMQRAMLSSVGTWAGAIAEALYDDRLALRTAYALADQSPLGSAAAYGVPLPIDREYVAERLGFSKVQNNVLYAQNSRGKLEAAVVQALTQVLLDLSKFAQDGLLFTTAEFGFFSISDEMVTGSSIMPQKKNLSMLELIRAKARVMLGYEQQILSVLSGLPSGYNKDYQETKKPFMEAVDLAIQSLAVAGLTVSSLQPNEERLLAACTPELFATDQAYALVQQGMPFRDAYRKVGTSLAELPEVDAHESLRKRTHTGASGNLGLAPLLSSLQDEQELVRQKLAALRAGWKEMLTVTGGENS